MNQIKCIIIISIFNLCLIRTDAQILKIDTISFFENKKYNIRQLIYIENDKQQTRKKV